MQALLDALAQSKLILLAFATIGLAICIVIEQSQLLLKYSGAVKQKVAGGYNAAMKIMVLNRFGAVLYFFIISIVIDLGVRAATIASAFVFAIVAIAIFDLAIVISSMRREQLSPGEVLGGGHAFLPIAMSSIAALFGILGLTLPMLLSSENPALRLTMANSGFLLNSIFTIITVFFVESYLAKIIDGSSDQRHIGSFVVAVFVMRFLSAIAATILMFAVIQHTDLLNVSGWF